MTPLEQIKLPEWNYTFQFVKKLKLCTKLVPGQYMKVFTVKFVSNNL